MPQKLLVIVGITGNQGHSIATHFLKDPTYRIRGLTRNPSSTIALSLQSQGIELVTADLDDPSTLPQAFHGANLIFSVTNYWTAFFDPAAPKLAEEKGISRAQYARDVEYAQGVNIADAAALTVSTLDENGFIASTLSSARECSGGAYEDVYHFDGKADVFPMYVRDRYPELARKMSCVQTGCFMTSFRLARNAYFAKQADGTYLTRMPMSADSPIQHVDINADMGAFVYAVSQMPPGRSYMAAGTTCTWPEYAATWSRVTGVKCGFESINREEMVKAVGADRETGVEISVMFEYSDAFGYDGCKGKSNRTGENDRDEVLLEAKDLREVGIECPMTTLEDFMKRQDWSEVLRA